jgi:hypothetical protein
MRDMSLSWATSQGARKRPNLDVRPDGSRTLSGSVLPSWLRPASWLSPAAAPCDEFLSALVTMRQTRMLSSGRRAAFNVVDIAGAFSGLIDCRRGTATLLSVIADDNPRSDVALPNGVARAGLPSAPGAPDDTGAQATTTPTVQTASDAEPRPSPGRSSRDRRGGKLNARVTLRAQLSGCARGPMRHQPSPP